MNIKATDFMQSMGIEVVRIDPVVKPENDSEKIKKAIEALDELAQNHKILVAERLEITFIADELRELPIFGKGE